MISLCVPTRGRPVRFAAMVHSAQRTGSDFQVIAVRDKDDETYYPLIPEVRYVWVDRPMNGDYVQMSGLWDTAWKCASGDIAMLCGDDVMFETKGWDKEVQRAFTQFPDRIGMVYCNVGMEDRPVLPFVSREWIDALGYFTPHDWPGWMPDEWIWSLAAELGRVIYLEDVITRHNQFGMDPTYTDGMRAREAAGGLGGMRNRFYSWPKVLQRDADLKKLRAALTSSFKTSPPGPPEWMTNTLVGNEKARWHHDQQVNKTLVTVHCYSGDKAIVKRHLPLYQHHGTDVLVLSPEDAPVKLRGVRCKSAGLRGYFGQGSLDRQRQHLAMLLEEPYDFFLLNDADSFCISPVISRYLYEQASQGVVFSNEVVEWRPHTSPYPKIAMQPPYFLSRNSLVNMLLVAGRPSVLAHPITPFIDWYMVALTCEAGLRHASFVDGTSFPAWRWNETDIPETVQQGHDFKHTDNPRGEIRGDLGMIEAVKRGSVFLHSVKHANVERQLLKAHADYVRRGSPQVNTITIDEYVRRREEFGEIFTVQINSSFTEGDSVRELF